MLIAIMGATFGRCEETAEGSMLRERLQLIMENQFLPKMRNLHRTKYLVSITAVKEDDDQEHIMKEIRKDI